MKNINRLRYLGNLLTIIGYTILLHVDPLIGGIIKVVGFSLVIPSCYKLKLYDVIFLLSVFAVLDISAVIKALLNY